MDTQQRIAQRVFAEHLAIAERLRVNPRIVLRHALGNVARWSREFTPDHRPDWLAVGVFFWLIAVMVALVCRLLTGRYPGEAKQARKAAVAYLERRGSYGSQT